MKRFKTVEDYIESSGEWTEILTQLRKILLASELEETIKWGAPAYTYEGKTLIGLGAFKNFVSIWFHQGVFLKDEAGILLNAQEGITKALRQWRVEKGDIIDENLLKTYIFETIENHEVGMQIKPQKKPLVIPPELQLLLDGDQTLNNSFESLSLTKKREFAEYISQAKRASTKTNRLEKIRPMIIQGIGLNDKYRK